MAVSRFVFLARRTDEDGADDRRDDISWMLVSSNSRPLGRAVRWHHGLDACLAEVHTVRAHLDRLRGVMSVVNAGRNWRWRVDLDGNPVAEASRVYVRQYECDYNMRRFLEALPVADIPSTVRMVHRGSDG
jgi:hypothetical protein